MPSVPATAAAGVSVDPASNVGAPTTPTTAPARPAADGAFQTLLDSATATTRAVVHDGVTTLGEMVGTAAGYGLASAYLPGTLGGASGWGTGPSGLGATAATPALRDLIEAASAQLGKPYVFGAEAGLDEIDPEAFDCSELTQWAAHQAGLTLPDGAAGQYRYCRAAGTTMSVEEALRTPGALLFTFDGEPGPTGGEPSRAHVAISLGDGRTVEARGRDYGVVVADAADRFNFAARVPA
jgi:cell wall-associated NlpC family hydrolase